MLSFYTKASILLLNLSSLSLLATARGDALNRTMCYCGTDGRKMPHNDRRDISPVPAGVEANSVEPHVAKRANTLQAFWYRFDYYNAHLDRVFTLDKTCRSSLRRRDEDKDEEDCLDYVHAKDTYCKHFGLSPGEVSARHGRPRHHFCYKFRARPKPDQYTFDGQKRKIPSTDALIEELRDDIRAVCEPICKKEYGLPMMKGHWYWRSRIDYVIDQADMCSDCA